MIKKQRYAVLYGEFENEKKMDKEFFWPWQILTDFLIFPSMIWIFTEGKGDGIKSRREPSKIFSTLSGMCFIAFTLK